MISKIFNKKFTKSLIPFQNVANFSVTHTKVYFSFYSNVFQIAIIGGGAGGQAVASQLARSKRFGNGEITIFDPSETHYYQPSYTMVGGGVLGNV